MKKPKEQIARLQEKLQDNFKIKHRSKNLSNKPNIFLRRSVTIVSKQNDILKNGVDHEWRTVSRYILKNRKDQLELKYVTGETVRLNSIDGILVDPKQYWTIRNSTKTNCRNMAV